MLGRVVVENGVKKIVPLTADCGSGNPCGAIITVYQRTVPNGYLPLGAQYDITQFPVLYSILGTDTIPTASALGLPTLTTGQYVIKATSGINENQADNVLSALSPVDVVALNNVHSVTSNAVYKVTRNINSAEVNITYHDAKMIFRRVGRVVTFSIGGAFRDVPAGGWFGVGTVPSGYRPPVEQLTFREQTGVGLVFRLYTNGAIELYNYTGASVAVSNGFFEGTWITNE